MPYSGKPWARPGCPERRRLRKTPISPTIAEPGGLGKGKRKSSTSNCASKYEVNQCGKFYSYAAARCCSFRFMARLRLPAGIFPVRRSVFRRRNPRGKAVFKGVFPQTGRKISSAGQSRASQPYPGRKTRPDISVFRFMRSAAPRRSFCADCRIFPQDASIA